MVAGRGLDLIQTKAQQENEGTSTSQEQKQEQHLPMRHAGRPADFRGSNLYFFGRKIFTNQPT